MIVDLQRIIESKLARREYLGVLPIGERLRMLDAMREREIAIRGRDVHSSAAAKRFPKNSWLNGTSSNENDA